MEAATPGSPWAPLGEKFAQARLDLICRVGCAEFQVSDAGLTQRFSLDCVPACRRAVEVTIALKLDSQKRPAAWINN